MKVRDVARDTTFEQFCELICVAHGLKPDTGIEIYDNDGLKWTQERFENKKDEMKTDKEFNDFWKNLELSIVFNDIVQARKDLFGILS